MYYYIFDRIADMISKSLLISDRSFTNLVKKNITCNKKTKLDGFLQL